MKETNIIPMNLLGRIVQSAEEEREEKGALHSHKAKSTRVTCKKRLQI